MTGTTDIARLRILPFDRAHGAYQLAATEAVIDAVGRGDAPPTLRMYSWSRDSLILGVGQSSTQIDVEACHAIGCDILRRISGGTAVFHDGNTVSFQLVLPTGHPFLSDDIHVNYEHIAGIVVSMLASLRVFGRWASIEEARQDAPPAGLDSICFSSLAPYEVMTRGRKLVGLAQVRRRSVTALQGMIYLRLDAAKSVRLLVPGAEPTDRLAAILSGRTIDLERAAAREVSSEEVVSAFRRSTIDALSVGTVEAGLTAFERQRTEELVRTRYGNPEWTFRR